MAFLLSSSVDHPTVRWDSPNPKNVSKESVFFAKRRDENHITQLQMFSSDAVCLGYGQIYSLRSARCSHTCTPDLWIFLCFQPCWKIWYSNFFLWNSPSPHLLSTLLASRQKFGSAWRTSIRGCKCRKPCRRVFVKSSFDVQISRWERLR